MVNAVPWTHYLYAGLAGLFLSVAGYTAWLLIRDIRINRPKRITLPVWDFQPEKELVRIISDEDRTMTTDRPRPYDWAREETE